jgi:CheY-like chemotaxis protein
MFPITREIVEPQPADPDDAQYRARNQETILLAEDEESLRLLTERILTDHGYTVIAASNGQHAMELAEHHSGTIDLLLTDVIMPHMNGHDLATQLRADRPTLPVIYVSGYAEPLLASRGTLPADVTLLSKPVTQQQILAALHRALDTRQPHRSSPSPSVRTE